MIRKVAYSNSLGTVQRVLKRSVFLVAPAAGGRKLDVKALPCRRDGGATAIRILLLLVLLWQCACSARKLFLPPYDEFARAREHAVPGTLLEIYGHYSAAVSGKTVRSHFNLLLDPGKSAYLEIVNPADQLLYAVSLDQDEVSLLWVQDRSFIQEKATPQNLNAIAGLPVMPDDLLLLIAGYGLNFPEWRMDRVRREGWNLSRSEFQGELTLKEELSKIVVLAKNGPGMIAKYDHYRLVNNKSLPARIRFEVPARKISIDLEIEKWIPRDEPASRDLFAIKLPDHAERLTLKEIYHGKPLLLQ